MENSTYTEDNQKNNIEDFCYNICEFKSVVTLRMNRNLKEKIDTFKGSSFGKRFHFYMDSLFNAISELENELQRVKGERYVNSSSLGDSLDRINKRLDQFESLDVQNNKILNEIMSVSKHNISRTGEFIKDLREYKIKSSNNLNKINLNYDHMNKNHKQFIDFIKTMEDKTTSTKSKTIELKSLKISKDKKKPTIINKKTLSSKK